MTDKAQHKRRTNRVFKSLHKPLTYLRVERTLFYFLCVGAVGAFNLFNSILLEPRGYVMGQLTRKPDGRTLILHLLNYDRQAPAENVKVRLELSGLVDLRETKDLSRWEVKVLSPGAAQPQFADVSLHGSVCEFTLRRIQHYTVVTLSTSPMP